MLELLELELLRELLATSTESAAKAKRKIRRINRKSHVLAGPIRDSELSLYVSMTASFLLQNRKRAYAPHITGRNLFYRNKFSAPKFIFFSGFYLFKSSIAGGRELKSTQITSFSSFYRDLQVPIEAKTEYKTTHETHYLFKRRIGIRRKASCGLWDTDGCRTDRYRIRLEK